MVNETGRKFSQLHFRPEIKKSTKKENRNMAQCRDKNMDLKDMKDLKETTPSTARLAF